YNKRMSKSRRFQFVMTLINDFFENWGDSVWTATIETFQMVGIAFIISLVIGMSLSILLVLTRPNQRLENKFVYQVLNVVINIVRSIPFIILLFLILPFTKIIVGTTIGVKGVLVPLVVFTAPFIA